MFFEINFAQGLHGTRGRRHEKDEADGEPATEDTNQAAIKAWSAAIPLLARCAGIRSRHAGKSDCRITCVNCQSVYNWITRFQYGGDGLERNDALLSEMKSSFSLPVNRLSTPFLLFLLE